MKLHTFILATIEVLLSLGKAIAVLFMLYSTSFCFLLFSFFYSATPESLQTMDIMEGQKLIINIGEFSLQLAVWGTVIVTAARLLYGLQKRRSSEESCGVT
ncbi:hypothetical protein MW344_003789 [Vibrio parahaemolyticus]|uniref:Uncharacterized protein n=1 Tax=Vibrio parahaemolyticus TaxID=670 RepID=A0A9Q3UFG4_VIBPH|nr:hypothetical protein [Vibrio parahaemolyticus]EGQ8101957.1 hypothetical protein [Vibrio parahaemolyticus]EGQ8548741.1 hypothetical protein [Vibrio parahaemolyticus]EGQ9073840.1 hypothetical protein [Vibrio parahaemolyticus]EGQ9129663.1 hypothetical protein [Vibrio parahaemolyticus]EGQ9286422.1 hypothetical protein [Vibrio parahaemolyticus]